MRVKVSITKPTAQVVNVPCDPSITVNALIEAIRKRAKDIPADVKLFFDGGELFGEDTLNDLGIVEGNTIYDTDGAPSNTTPAAATTAPAPAPTPTTPVATTTQSNAATTPTTTSDASGDSGNAGAPAPAPPTPVDTPTIVDNINDQDAAVSLRPRPIAEVIMVCFDISSSMKATFVNDLDDGIGSSVVSRVNAAKICFGAFIDKTLAYEYPHAMGLTVFGQSVREIIPISNNLDQFEFVFGQLDDSEGATYLYPAVNLAVGKILDYKNTLHKSGVDISEMKARIIAFTDGEDNSNMKAFDVVRKVLENNIVVDAVVIGGSDDAHHQLRSLANCSGGFAIRIPAERQTLNAVFERESVLALSRRAGDKPVVTDKITQAEFNVFGDVSKYPMVGVEALRAAAKPRVATTTPSSSKFVSLANNSNAGKTIAAATKVAATTGGGGGANAIKRISKELQEITTNPDPFFEVFVTDTNLFDWKAVITGPPNTPYAGGHWVVSLVLPNNYPFQPPKLLFMTDIYSCNVSSEGRVCLNILKDSWSPALTIAKVFANLRVMLEEPDTLDALDAWKGQLARQEPDVYKRNVREHTNTNASQPVDDLKRSFNLL